MKELVIILLNILLFGMIVSWYRRLYLRRKYGCTRCYYRRLMHVNGNLGWHCTAACGNESGIPCPAWRYCDFEGQI